MCSCCLCLSACLLNCHLLTRCFLLFFLPFPFACLNYTLPPVPAFHVPCNLTLPSLFPLPTCNLALPYNLTTLTTLQHNLTTLTTLHSLTTVQPLQLYNTALQPSNPYSLTSLTQPYTPLQPYTCNLTFTSLFPFVLFFCRFLVPASILPSHPFLLIHVPWNLIHSHIPVSSPAASGRGRMEGVTAVLSWGRSEQLLLSGF